MRIPLAVILFVSVQCLITGSPLPERDLDNRVERNTGKVNELKSKLSKLQLLINELQKDEDGEENAPILTSSVSKAAPAQSAQREPMGEDNAGDEDAASNDLVQRIASGLSPRDVETLRALKKMLETARHLRGLKNPEEDLNNDATKADEGAFYDEPVRQESYNQVSWRNLARQLQRERDSFYLDRRSNNNGNDLGQFTTHTEEGSFGAFRDEIKGSVEKNLLTDIALAINSGISVDEIIDDLEGGAKSKPQNWGNY